MEIEEIPIDQFEPNPWNPNVMDKETCEHLKKEYKRVGMLQPILARPHKGKYQILDGEHRWRMGIEFGLTTLKTVVVEMNDSDAKLTTINMNRIKGADDPLKLAELLKDLSKTLDSNTLSQIINMHEGEMNAYIDLSSLPNLSDFDLSPNPRFCDCPKCGAKIELDKIRVYHDKKTDKTGRKAPKKERANKNPNKKGKNA